MRHIEPIFTLGSLGNPVGVLAYLALGRAYQHLKILDQLFHLAWLAARILQNRRDHFFEGRFDTFLARAGYFPESPKEVKNQPAGVLRVKQQRWVFQHQAQQRPTKLFDAWLNELRHTWVIEQVACYLFNGIDGMTRIFRETFVLFGELLFQLLKNVLVTQRRTGIE